MRWWDAGAWCSSGKGRVWKTPWGMKLPLVESRIFLVLLSDALYVSHQTARSRTLYNYSLFFNRSSPVFSTRSTTHPLLNAALSIPMTFKSVNLFGLWKLTFFASQSINAAHQNRYTHSSSDEGSKLTACAKKKSIVGKKNILKSTR